MIPAIRTILFPVYTFMLYLVMEQYVIFFINLFIALKMTGCIKNIIYKAF